MRILLAVMVATLACSVGRLGAETPSATSPDGKRVATANDKAVVVTEGQRIVLKVAGHTAAVTALAYSPDGKRLASADQSGQVHLLDTGTGKLLLRVTAIEGANGLAFSADGGTLEVKSAKATKKYDTATGAEKP